MKMIEVPEEHLLRLREWRLAHAVGDRIYISSPIDDLIACLPKPIEVGSRVSVLGRTATVIAIADDDAWLQHDNGNRHTWPIAKLEVVE